MKKLTDLDKQMVIFDESMIRPGMIVPSYRGVLKNVLNVAAPQNNEQSAIIGQLLLKLRVAEPTLEIENEDFKLIMEKLNLNEAKIFGGFHSQLYLWLKEIEKEGEKK
jgi:hypothetical protein